jgi:hypothetical protein
VISTVLDEIDLLLTKASLSPPSAPFRRQRRLSRLPFSPPSNIAARVDRGHTPAQPAYLRNLLQSTCALPGMPRGSRWRFRWPDPRERTRLVLFTPPGLRPHRSLGEHGLRVRRHPSHLRGTARPWRGSSPRSLPNSRGECGRSSKTWMATSSSLSKRKRSPPESRTAEDQHP